jgi:methionine-rich copper-binding protein CopC
MNLRRLAAALLLSGVAVVVTATPAFAHAELTGSSPAQNASLAEAPHQVQLTFSETVTLADNPVTVAGPGGVSWTAGQASIAGTVVTVPVAPSGPAGAYTLTYQVISDDGDPISGTVQFTLTTAVSGATITLTAESTSPSTTSAPTSSTAAAATSTSDSGGGVPVWVWILAAVVVVVVGLVVALRLGRPKRTGA